MLYFMDTGVLPLVFRQINNVCENCFTMLLCEQLPPVEPMEQQPTEVVVKTTPNLEETQATDEPALSPSGICKIIIIRVFLLSCTWIAVCFK